MQLTVPLVRCLKASCAAAQELDVAKMFKDEHGWNAVGATRPAGWIAGPADANDLATGLCPAHAAEWEAAKQDFITQNLPPAPPLPEPVRQFSVQPAKCDPVSSVLVQHIEDSAHAPIEPPKPMGMSSIPTRAVPMTMPRIEPHVSQASGGYGCSMPASLPSKPIMPVFHSSGGQNTVPVAMGMANPVMPVQVQTSPLPARLLPADPAGTFSPIEHDTKANYDAARVVITHTPFEPAKI